MDAKGMIDKEFWKSKKVFITGHTGFKGAWLSHWLISMGAEVTGYALEPNYLSLYNIIKIDKNINSIIGDIKNLNKLKTAILQSSPDIIFHMAAQPLVRESYKNPVNTYETNVMGTVNVLESIRNCDTVKSVVIVTTDKVYQNEEWIWGYREDEKLCGFDPYSNSKSCAELVTHSYKNSFFDYENSPAISTARSGNVIGGGDFAIDRIIPDCINAVQKGENVKVRNPYSVRPYQHVLDCLSGYLILSQKQFENKKNYEGNYNFGPEFNDCITTGKLVDLFCKAWGNNQSWISEGDDGPHESNFLKLDCSKAKMILSWKHAWEIQLAIEKTVGWYKNYLNHENMPDYMDIQLKEYLKYADIIYES